MIPIFFSLQFQLWTKTSLSEKDIVCGISASWLYRVIKFNNKLESNGLKVDYKQFATERTVLSQREL